MSSTTRRRVVAALAVLLVAAPGAALAQNTATPQSQIAQLNQEALSAFMKFAYRGGSRKLRRAVGIADDNNLVHDPALAMTHVLLGVAAVAGRSDAYRGLHYFVRAQRLDSKIKVPEKLMTPELLETWRAAGRAIKVLGKPPRLVLGRKRRAADVEIKKVKGARGLMHDSVDTVKRGYAIAIKATVGDDLRVSHVYVYYRAAGKVAYKKVTMKRRANVYRANIPAAATKGRYVHYYIQALDPRNRPAARHGSAKGPNVVIVKK